MHDGTAQPDCERCNSEAELEEKLIRVVNHHRHDWMNDLQVLLGYIQLNKQDRLRAYLDKLLDKLYRESLVARLGNPSLIAYFFTFRTGNHPLTLTVRPEREIHLGLGGGQGVLAAEAMIAVIQAYCAAATLGDGGGNELLLSLDLEQSPDDAGIGDLTMVFHYTGDYDAEVLLSGAMPAISQFQAGPDSEATYELTKNAARVTLRQRWNGLEGGNSNVLG